MKKQLFGLALLLSLSAASATSTFATASQVVAGREYSKDRDHDKGKDRGQGKGKHDGRNGQKRLDAMAKELDLNSKQKSKVEKIFKDQHEQMQALRSRSGNDRSQMKADAQRIRQNTDKQLKDVLNKKQYAQLEAKRQERMRQMGQRRGDNDRRDFDGRNNNRRS
jgi:Spy/CpxP family protein refolding chaperone